MQMLEALGSYLSDPVDPYDPARAWASYFRNRKDPQKAKEAVDVTARFFRQAPVGVPLWLLSRGQQALYHGSKGFSDALPRYSHQYRQTGRKNPWQQAHWPAARQGARQAALGFVGLNRPLSGYDMLEGAVKNPVLRNIAGFGLDLTADPFHLAAAGLARPLGRMGRFMKNARERYLNRRQKAALRNLGWTRWFYDVPVPPSERVPLIMRTHKPVHHVRNRMFDPPIEPVRGLYRPRERIVFVDKKEPRDVVDHEISHHVDELLPSRWRPLANRMYERFVEYDPVLANELRQAGYDRLSKAGLGEEMLARYTQRGWQAPYPFLQRLQERTRQAIHPSMYTDAPPVPLHAVTLGGRAVVGAENIRRRLNTRHRNRSPYWDPRRPPTEAW